MTDLQSAALLTEVRALLQSARALAARQVNALQVLTKLRSAAASSSTSKGARSARSMVAPW